MRLKGQRGARSDGLGSWGEEEQAHSFPGSLCRGGLRGRWGSWRPSILQESRRDVSSLDQGWSCVRVWNNRLKAGARGGGVDVPRDLGSRLTVL